MAAQSSESIQAHKKKKSHSFRGVRLRKWGRWAAEIRVPNSRKKIWLGSFSSVEQAARAYDAAAYRLRGPDSYFNFPDSPPNNIEPAVIDSADSIRAVSRAYAMQLDSVKDAVKTAAGSEIDGHIISVAEQTGNNNNYIGDDQLTDQRVLGDFLDDTIITVSDYFTVHQPDELRVELDNIVSFPDLWDFTEFHNI